MYRSKAIPLHADAHIDDGLDELVGALDLLATQVDTGTRPAAAYEGRGFFETNRFSRDTGLAWEEVTGGGGAGKPFQTRVVAASDAISGTGADYTCDGTDDQAQINSAVTDLGATGGIVHLTEGNFSITGTISLSSNVILEGCGEATILKIPSGNASTFDMIQNATQTAVGNTYLQIRNLVVDGNLNNVTGTNKGIEFLNVHQFWIEHCTIQNTTGSGIYIGSAGAVSSIEGWITENEFYNIATNAVEFVASPTDMFICDNLFSTCDKGIVIPGGSRYILSGNHFDTITTYGIDNNGGDDVTVTENEFNGAATAHAIYFYGTANYCVINDNTIQGVLYGMDLQTVNDSSVCGNTINTVANGYGIYLYPVTSCTIVGNTLLGTTGSYAIWMSGVTDSIISLNVMYGHAATAIHLQTGCHRNLFMGNTLYQVGEAMDFNADSDDALVVGNVLYGKNVLAQDSTSANPLIQANVAASISDVFDGEMVAADESDNNKNP